MSTKKTETEAVKNEQAATADTPGGTEKAGTVVYCGPSVKGVARQFTVYHGGYPEALEKFIKDYPAARGLIVPLDKFAAVRARLETAGSAESILYNKVKSML